MKAFFGLLLGLMIPAILIGMTFRQKGLNQRYQALDHPLNKMDFLFIAYQGGSGEMPANTWEAMDYVRSKVWPVVIWLDVHQTKDGQLVLFGPDMLERQTNGEGHISLTDWSVVKNLDAGYLFRAEDGSYPFRGRGFRIQTLEDTLKRHPLDLFVLNIRTNTRKIDLEISALLEKYQAEKRVIVTSPYEIVTKTVKKQKPLGMYGVGLSEYTRLNMFNSIFLGAAIPVKGDILVTHRKRYLRSLDAEMIEEFHRRKKKVVAWASNEEEWSPWRGKDIDGLLTDRPSSFVNLIPTAGKRAN